MVERGMEPVESVRDAGRAAVLLQPLRLDIVRRLLEPDSASGLARAMDMPRQKLNYHVRVLEELGLPIPTGWALDESHQTTDQPQAVRKVEPLGGATRHTGVGEHQDPEVAGKRLTEMLEPK